MCGEGKRRRDRLFRAFHAQSAVLQSVDVLPAGAGVLEIGRATLTVKLAGQPQAQFDVKYVVHWKMEESGTWISGI